MTFANVCFDCGETANCFFDDGQGARWICKKHMEEAMDRIHQQLESPRRSAEIIFVGDKD